MANKLDFHLVDQIATAKTLERLKAILSDVATRLNATGYFCTIECERPHVPCIRWSFGSVEPWASGFKNTAFINLDPIWEKSLSEEGVFSWQCPANPMENREYWRACDRAGVQHGISVAIQLRPIWKMTISFACRHEDQLDYVNSDDDNAKLHMVGISILHCLIQSVMPDVVNQSLPKISVREITCLKWAARGKTASEIARELHISEPTVVFHMTNVMRKLKVSNRTQAIAVGTSLGLTT
jgi:LuxR family transcriptional regulator, activator of conjugal transfer of Ti plasmids